MKVLSVESRSDQYDILVTVETGWWFWARQRTFRGSGTVWHDAETGKRANTDIEAALSDVATKHRWDQEDKKPYTWPLGEGYRRKPHVPGAVSSYDQNDAD